LEIITWIYIIKIIEHCTSIQCIRNIKILKYLDKNQLVSIEIQTSNGLLE